MHFSSKHSIEDEIPFPMTAMVDVIFLLLIFFVSTSVFYRLEAEMKIEIPVAEQALISARTAGKVIVNVRNDGIIIVNQRELTVEELEDLLKRVASLFEGHTVIIRGDAACRHQDIMNVLDACAAANVWNVSFAAATESASQPAGGVSR